MSAVDDYVRAVAAHLSMPEADRRIVLDDLRAQLDERAATVGDWQALHGFGPAQAYAEHANAEFATEHDGRQATILGMPASFGGPPRPDGRSGMWDPASEKIFVPKRFGVGWTINFAALLVKVKLIRPDDPSEDLLDNMPARANAASLLLTVVAALACLGYSMWARTLGNYFPHHWGTWRPNAWGTWWVAFAPVLVTSSVGLLGSLLVATLPIANKIKMVIYAVLGTLVIFFGLLGLLPIIGRHDEPIGWVAILMGPLTLLLPCVFLYLSIRGALHHDWRRSQGTS